LTTNLFSQERKLEDWSANLYLRYEAERTRPAIDLLNRTRGDTIERIVDLGCGPGNSTELLVNRFPQADILGVDSSEDMLAKARVRLPGVAFEKAKVEHWRSPRPVDLIFANAVLQWVPRHIEVMVGLMSQLAPGGRLAVQVPDNFDEPSHVLMRKIAAEAPFRETLADAGGREAIGTFVDYYAALLPHSADIDVWRTIYAHALKGPDAIVEWLQSTGLRPFLAPLSAAQRATFLARYGEAIAAAYPPLADGRVLLPFPRLFIVATKGNAGNPHS
jgi:trans-aconitate 2-methyltransferase